MLRQNLIDTKYCQMAFRSPSNGAPISPIQQSFGTPGQTKVSGDNQRETTHEFYCLATEDNPVDGSAPWCGCGSFRNLLLNSIYKIKIHKKCSQSWNTLYFRPLPAGGRLLPTFSRI
jgi:hypothetical protein